MKIPLRNVLSPSDLITRPRLTIIPLHFCSGSMPKMIQYYYKNGIDDTHSFVKSEKEEQERKPKKIRCIEDSPLIFSEIIICDEK